MSNTERFLEGSRGRPTDAGDLYLGQGSGALEILVTSPGEAPGRTRLRELWRARAGGRGVPLLVVALSGHKAALCGPGGEEPPAYLDLDAAVVERVCAVALGRPNRHAALRYLHSVLPHLESTLPGIRNEGLLTIHELTHGVPSRDDFAVANEHAGSAFGRRGTELLAALGFGLERLDDYTYVLTVNGRRRGAAVLLLPDEMPDTASRRLSGLSPVSYVLSVAERHNVPYALLLSERSLRLHPVKDGLGVAQRGRTETYVEADLDLLPPDRAGYLWLLFSAAALGDGGSFEQILARARDHATDLGGRLRERVYEDVIPHLAMAIWQARGIERPTAAQMSETYEMALLVLFRLLFIGYAEDKDLLPYRTNEAYRRRSLKKLARELHNQGEAGPVGEGTSYWDEVQALGHAVNEGRPEWGVPQYDGRLFSTDPKVSPVGAEAERIRLPNTAFRPVLYDLLIDQASGETLTGPVDFSALGVREFGTVYEGLLQNDLALAETDLTLERVKDQLVYSPVDATKHPESVRVRRGEAYLRTASGARKSTGSYYTKPFAVAHLLDQALEPALAAHLERLGQLPEDAAGEAFFDFRVADIAMGSGHFLVAAVDRIERRLSQYLSERPLPLVREELARLRQVALAALGPEHEGFEIEDTQLLRRQIARRCVYGVDLNPLAVQLAQVSLWIHTFVPGLPLSFLDRNLVQGNSLVGIATLDELLAEAGRYTAGGLLFSAQQLLAPAQEPLERLARLTDADAREVAAAREAVAEARAAIAPAQAVCDVLTAARTDSGLQQALQLGAGAADVLGQWVDDPAAVLGSNELARARGGLAELRPFHFPIAFPEVFLRRPVTAAHPGLPVPLHREGEAPAEPLVRHTLEAPAEPLVRHTLAAPARQEARPPTAALPGRAGFDCILGNPPWEEATVEEDRFWTRHFPGLHSLTERLKQREVARYREERPDLVAECQRERAVSDKLREALVKGPFPGMGTGDPDLYKAFCWRFWTLVRAGGHLGVVLPRSVFASGGSKEFRAAIFDTGRAEDLTFLLNRDHWVFDDAEPRYTIVLASLRKQPWEGVHREGEAPAEPPAQHGDDTARQEPRPPEPPARHGDDTARQEPRPPVSPRPPTVPVIAIRGPYDRLSRFREGVARPPVTFAVAEAQSWTDNAALPLLPDEESLAVFAQLRAAPRLDRNDRRSWRARPFRELDATNDKGLMDVKSTTCPPGYWPVFKGESFDLWQPDTGTYYAWAEPGAMTEHLQDKRWRSRTRANSPWSEFDPQQLGHPRTLPCRRPRIAFRDITNRTNTRTIVTALVPAGVLITNTGPCFVWPRGDERDQAYLLGVLSSRPLDWYARRFVEMHANFHVVNAFPVPRPARESRLWQRVVQLSGRLASPDERFAQWAAAVGVECGRLGEDEKAAMIAELDAVVAHLYGLTEAQLRHLYATFHEGWKAAEREAYAAEVVPYYRAWSGR